LNRIVVVRAGLFLQPVGHVIRRSPGTNFDRGLVGGSRAARAR
jgi:hypothetical protein